MEFKNQINICASDFAFMTNWQTMQQGIKLSFTHSYIKLHICRSSAYHGKVLVCQITSTFTHYLGVKQTVTKSVVLIPCAIARNIFLTCIFW